MLAKLDVAVYIFLPVAIIASARISLLLFLRQCATLFGTLLENITHFASHENGFNFAFFRNSQLQNFAEVIHNLYMIRKKLKR